MSSRKETYDGFRPYFDSEGNKIEKPALKEVQFMPSTIETVDVALFNWLNEELNIFCTTNEGWKKVPLIWSMAERSYQIKDKKELRNKDVFTLPAISIERTSVNKDPSMKGVAWSNIPRQNDAKGGAITVARRLQQEKTANFQNADAKRIFNQQTYPYKSEKAVYETITMPLPTYMVMNYKLTVNTEYQQQMNEIITPFLAYTGQINNFFMNNDGHRFEGFVDGDFGLENNIANLSDEERKFVTSINLKVLGYLMGSDKNDEQPKMTIRESAAEIRIVRERVIFGDKKEY
ncbi:MAG TPA: hypothetical protein DCX27_10105 [Balneola sp.]|nr:hypothetical protein [Balneola sp.]|tara:strand:+ start:1468 stop:2337 length:870 start_codon:yes stop_codon:yes gene_type:complete